MRSRRTFATTLVVAASLMPIASPTSAQTEVQFQYGNLLDQFSNESAGSWVLTLQHASFWSHGDNFFFADFVTAPDDRDHDVQDVWMEWYSNFSLGSIFGSGPGDGVIRDVGFLPGINIGADPNILQILPGARLSWKLPGFLFLNTDFSLALDRSAGLAGRGAPSTDARFFFDVNGTAVFGGGPLQFMLSGHAEYAASTTNELGEEVPFWVLAQPQLTVDAGGLVGAEGKLFLGVEYQYWKNKLGSRNTESVPQFLAIWRF